MLRSRFGLGTYEGTRNIGLWFPLCAIQKDLQLGLEDLKGFATGCGKVIRF